MSVPGARIPRFYSGAREMPGASWAGGATLRAYETKRPRAESHDTPMADPSAG